MNKYYLFAFNQTHTAMEFEDLLKKEINVIVMSTLREITVGCGISLKISENDIEKALSKIKEAKKASLISENADYKLYLIDGIGKSKTVTLVSDETI